MEEIKQNLKEERRNRIVLAGLKVFCEKGYEGTTIDDITKRAKCSHGLFYHYFKSKKELFNQAVNLRGRASEEDISKKLESIIDYRDKLKYVINKLFSNLKNDENFAYFYFFFITQCFTHRDNERAPRKKSAPSRKPPFVLFEEIFEGGQQVGVFTAKKTPRELARLVHSIIQGATLGYIIAPKEVRKKMELPDVEFIINMFKKETD